MSSIKISDGIIKDDILVVGVSIKSGKGALHIESGDLALEAKSLIATLNDLGATGKVDEVILIPGTTTRLIAFTGLGKSVSTFDDEVLRPHLRLLVLRADRCVSTVKHAANAVFQQPLLVRLGDKVALDIMVKELIELGLRVCRQDHPAFVEMQHRITRASQLGKKSRRERDVRNPLSTIQGVAPQVCGKTIQLFAEERLAVQVHLVI